ncbi:MAG: dTDP-4-amino-4,6-dideoxygalactose transaminase [Paraglaciecola sp.]|jgi:dTDP-4-amino-4,6-dideoxygalactose transaminase
MITVTKPWLPDRKKLDFYIDKIYSSGHITNDGPLLKLLEERLQKYLGVKNLILVNNGTTALQVAYEALELKGEIITTPFSFIATSSSIVWQGKKAVFADISSDTLNIDPNQIIKKINKNTSAIVPVHCFGNPVDVAAVKEISENHNLKTIYDASHAFGIKNSDGSSILNSGDVSTLSFHATKLFHTIEGGAIITSDDELAQKIRIMIRCGIPGKDSVQYLGTNAKMNEFSAAMGLCILEDIETILQRRKRIWEQYVEGLKGLVIFQLWSSRYENNYAYVPVIFSSSDSLLSAEKALSLENILPRRYFYPSLDTLDFLSTSQVCENSRDIASRIMCLPIYPGLSEQNVKRTIDIIRSSILEERQHSST